MLPARLPAHRRKEEAIQRTFKQVAAHFSDVFAELVPGGHAKLRILRAKPKKVCPSDAGDFVLGGGTCRPPLISHSPVPDLRQAVVRRWSRWHPCTEC